MELEYKWLMPEKNAAEESCSAIMSDPFMAGMAKGEAVIKMDSNYYDTEDGILKNKFHAALRIRKENGKSVLCLKIPKIKEGSFAAREEYETEAESIAEGLEILPGTGAPADLCRKISSLPLKKIARVCFIRHFFCIQSNNGCLGSKEESFIAEISFDEGHAERHLEPFSVSAISEIELEFKSGNEAFFHKWAENFARHFKLKPLSLSKLAQALFYQEKH